MRLELQYVFSELSCAVAVAVGSVAIGKQTPLKHKTVICVLYINT